jgi:hypothetical protein
VVPQERSIISSMMYSMFLEGQVTRIIWALQHDLAVRVSVGIPIHSSSVIMRHMDTLQYPGSITILWQPQMCHLSNFVARVTLLSPISRRKNKVLCLPLPWRGVSRAMTPLPVDYRQYDAVLRVVRVPAYNIKLE